MKSRAPPQLRVADHLANSKSRSPLPRTVRPTLAEVIWSLVSSGSIVLGSCLEFPSTVAVSSLEDRSTAGSRPSVTVSSPENRSTAGILSSDPRPPSTVSVSSLEDRSTAGNRPSVTVSSSEDRSTVGVRADLPLDDPLDDPVAEAMTSLVALVLDSSDRLDSGAGTLEVNRLILCRFGAMLLRGTLSSSMISLLLPGFFDIFVEMVIQ